MRSKTRLLILLSPLFLTGRASRINPRTGPDLFPRVSIVSL